MKQKSFSFYSLAIIGTTAVAMLLVVGIQYVQATYQKAVASGRSIRIQEANACQPGTIQGKDQPHFSGCNSIL